MISLFKFLIASVLLYSIQFTFLFDHFFIFSSSSLIWFNIIKRAFSLTLGPGWQPKVCSRFPGSRRIGFGWRSKVEPTSLTCTLGGRCFRNCWNLMLRSRLRSSAWCGEGTQTWAAGRRRTGLLALLCSTWLLPLLALAGEP